MATLLPPCKTDHAILLVAVRDERGVLRVPSSEAAALPGLNFAVKPLTPINEQLVATASAFFGRNVALALHVWQELADELTLPSGARATLYVASLNDPAVVATSAWPVIPELLRALPATKLRLPYLRAWQVLQGGLKVDTKALDVSDADMKKYFPKDDD